LGFAVLKVLGTLFLKKRLIIAKFGASLGKIGASLAKFGLVSG
jgi:hypothetical protein